MQQYRTLVWLMECFPETMAEELDQPFRDIDELLEQMDLTLAMGNRRMENRLEMSSRNYYRLRQQAITILSIRLWSAPSTDVDFWLEMLEFLEKME